MRRAFGPGIFSRNVPVRFHIGVARAAEGLWVSPHGRRCRVFPVPAQLRQLGAVKNIELESKVEEQVLAREFDLRVLVISNELQSDKMKMDHARIRLQFAGTER